MNLIGSSGDELRYSEAQRDYTKHKFDPMYEKNSDLSLLDNSFVQAFEEMMAGYDLNRVVCSLYPRGKTVADFSKQTPRFKKAGSMYLIYQISYENNIVIDLSKIDSVSKGTLDAEQILQVELKNKTKFTFYFE